MHAPSPKEPPSAGAPAPAAHVLVVDDDAALARSYQRILQRSGFTVDIVTDGTLAADAVRRGGFDAVLSDIDMPGLNGIELLRAAREHDLDLPILLMTASPAVTTAVQALDYGALGYLIKPIAPETLVGNLVRAAQLRRMAALKRESLRMIAGERFGVGDRAGLEAVFERALASLWMAYQPIVSWSRRQTFALEALVRSAEPAMRGPDALFDAAERLDRVRDLGRRIRARVAAAAVERPDATFFVNLHPSDLLDDELHSAAAPLTQVASRVVLEVTERASLDHLADVRARIASLRRAGFRIAVDDLGAGYAGLASFAQLEPDVVKIDMSLVRDVDANATKQKLVRSMASVCADLGLTLVVEGVETASERDMLVTLGCDLLQGYLFARPAHPPPPVAW